MASSMSVTGTCSYIGMTEYQYPNITYPTILLNLSGSQGIFTNFTITPEISGALVHNTGINSASSIYTWLAYPPENGTYADYFIGTFNHNNTTMSAVFPCLLKFGNSTQSQAKVNVTVKEENNGYLINVTVTNNMSFATIVNANVSLIIPPTFKSSSYIVPIKIYPSENSSTSFFVTPPSGSNFSYAAAVAVSYAQNGYHYANMTIFRLTNNTTVSTVPNKITNIINASNYIGGWLEKRGNYSSVSYAVTAVAQSDAYGYGPVYRLIGAANNGYSYQVGVSYNSSLVSNWYYPYFRFAYEVIAPNGTNVYGSISNFSSKINNGDKILLTLSLYAGNVVMSATDLDTGAVGYANYSTNGATSFNSIELGTSWLFASNSINQLPVSFSPYGAYNNQAYFFINGNVSGTSFWDNSTTVPFGNYSQFLFSSHNMTLYYNSSNGEFITGASKYANISGVYTLSKLSYIPPAKTMERISLSFAQNTSALKYNITAVAQSGAYGYGPAYIISGLSNKGYQYIFGIGYNFSEISGGYLPGFHIEYGMFTPNGTFIPPKGNSTSVPSFSGPIYPNDKILFSITFSNGNAIMQARDWDTGATASINYSAEGATYFVGNKTDSSNLNGYFSGFQTLWVTPVVFSNNEEPVVYRPYGQMPHSGWLWINSETAPTAVPISNKPTYILSYNNLTGFFNTSNGTFISGEIPSVLSYNAVNLSNEPIYSIRVGFASGRNVTSIGYNVTAVAQSDNYGNGPYYDISGMTSNGYSYFVILAYNNSMSSGFSSFFEADNPNGTYSLKRLNISNISNGNKVLLLLNLYNGNVTATIRDWNTGQVAQIRYRSSSTQFVGLHQLNTTTDLYFTGARIIWHNPYVPYYYFKNVTFQPYGNFSVNGTIFIHGFYGNASSSLEKNIFFNQTIVNGSLGLYTVVAHNISVIFNQTTGDVLIGTERQKQAIKNAPLQAHVFIVIAIIIILIAAILVSFAFLHKAAKKKAHKEYKIKR